jgi:ligand-binding SRPBCC domain-containing protein
MMMPVFETTTLLPCPPSRVFEFLCRAANLAVVTPPEYHARLVEAPERLQIGARIVLVMGRWGFSQRITSEVTALEENTLLVDEQRDGVFRKWIHTHRLEAIPEGTRMIDRIEFEPPGGMLGFVLTASAIEEELGEVFAYRAQRFKELLSAEDSGSGRQTRQ